MVATYQNRMLIREHPISFSPIRIPALKLWLKADAGTFQDSLFATPAAADADPVGGWQDQSGNGKHVVQATSSQKGTLKTGANGQNGKPLVIADGIDDNLNCASIVSSATDNFTIFFVSKTTSLGGFQCFFSNGSAGSGYAYFLVGNVRNPLYPPVDPACADTTNNYVDDVFEIKCLKRTSGTATFRINGSDHTLTNATSSPLAVLSQFTLFHRSDGSISRPKVGEILLYDAALTAQQIADVEAYLNARWAAF